MKSGFDCHAHVYSQVSKTLGSNYSPSQPAPLPTWLGYLEEHCLAGGVIVQPSFLGYDNRILLDQLSKLGSLYKGVVQLPSTTTDDEFYRLDAAGVVGVRWNLIEGRCELPNLSDNRWVDFLDCIKRMNWHLEIHLEGHRMPELMPALHEHGVTLVVDHFGLPQTNIPHDDKGFSMLLEMAKERRVWVKMSAPYRSPVDVLKPHVQCLFTHFGRERLVWGSDWPWTRHEKKHGYRDTYNWLSEWIESKEDQHYILDSSPRELFHIKSDQAHEVSLNADL